MKKIGGVIFLPLTVLFILFFVVLVWPFWNGQVVRSDTKVWPGVRVKIPDYWWEARKWLTAQKDFFRVLPLPMSKTYNVAFDWEQGYSGGDPMHWLSTQSFLFVNTGKTFKIPELVGGLIEREAKFKSLDKLLGFLNVKYLLLREDIRWDFLRGHNWWFKQTPENINLFLNQQKDLSLVKEIGKYKFYEIKPEYLLPHIYVPQVLTLVSGEAGAFVDIAPYLRPDEKEAVIITEQNEDKNNYLENQFNQSFIWQKPILLLKEETEKLSLGEVADSLPYTRILPSSRLYFLIQIKEYFGKLFSPFSKELGLRLTFTGKRLREVYGLLEKQSIPLVPQKSYVVKQINKELVLKTIKRSILEWQIIEKQVGKITDKDFKEKMAEEIKNQVLNQQAFLAALKEELAADQEEYFHSSIAELEKILEDRKQKDIEVDRITSGGNKKINSQEAIYQIEAPQDGQYELYVRDDQMAKYRDLSNNLISFTLDKEEKQERTIEFTDNNLISLGGLYLTKGLHEINLSVPSAYNLISDPSFEEGTWSGAVPMPLNLKSEINATQSADAFQGDFSLKLSSNQNNAVVFTPINNFAYGDIYKVSFAAKYAEGNQPYFGVWENDTESNLPDFNFQKINPRWGTADPQTLFSVLQDLPPDKNWRHYEFIIKPQDSTQSLGLAFFSLQLKVGKTVNLYDDVRVERIFTKPILLKGPLLKEAKNLPNIQFTKLRPTKYQVDVKNATEPYFLVFSESYHPGWQASVEGEHLMINGFANGWFIKKTGDYQIILDFRPQKIYYISMSISVLAFLTAMIFLLSKRRKNEGKK
ncbi:DUF3367 domain-containing protein [Candidatus Shapirobacteria bacterium]|nr:DUF3367 domain-containing protein [Candidatus Shapirobacteria bacterium]